MLEIANSAEEKDQIRQQLRFKDGIPKDLTSVVVYEFYRAHCNESYYRECVRHLNVEIGKNIGILRCSKK